VKQRHEYKGGKRKNGISRKHTYVMTADGKSVADVKRRIGLTSAMVSKFSKLWRSNSISNKTKVNLYETFVVPVLFYGSGWWFLRKEDKRRIITAEMT